MFASSTGLMQRKATLTKRPSSQGLLKDYQSCACTSSRDWQALFASATQLQTLVAVTVHPSGISRADVSRRTSTLSTSSKIGKLCRRVTSASASIASKRLRTTPSLLMEMIQSSLALWTMTLWMANSPTLMADPQASHLNGW